jgi:hypothetical protein
MTAREIARSGRVVLGSPAYFTAMQSPASGAT